MCGLASGLPHGLRGDFSYLDLYQITVGGARKARCTLRCTVDRRKGAKGGEKERMGEVERERDRRKQLIS